MDEKSIQRLLEELKDVVDMSGIYEKCNKRVDTISMAAAIKSGEVHQEKVFETIASNYAYIGFLEGVEFSLRNLEINEENE